MRCCQAIEQEVVEFRTLAVDVVGSVAAGNGLVLEVIAADPRGERHQVAVCAAVQGQVVDLGLGDDGSGR